MKQDDLQGSHLTNPAGMQNANRVQTAVPNGQPRRVPLPPSKPWPPRRRIPFWVQVFFLFSCVLALTVVVVRHIWHKRQADEVRAQAEKDQKARHLKAAELSMHGFAMLQEERRASLRKLCRSQGFVPLLFIDKIVCVRTEAIAWEKYDTPPEQDTTGDDEPGP